MGFFHEVIFQIGNKDNCGCETPEGERAAALKEFAEAFQERNPHLRATLRKTSMALWRSRWQTRPVPRAGRWW